MKYSFPCAILAFVFASFLWACEDDLSNQGSSLTQGEVSIRVDSVEHFIPAVAVNYDGYDSRSVTKLLGRINVPEFGSLTCSFLSQLYPSPTLGIPDSISVADVDSMRMVLSMPRGSLTGDSLAPQQLRVYRLNASLPADINNLTDPSLYCNTSDPSSLIGSRTYTLSALGFSDSLFVNQSEIRVPVRLKDEAAREVFEAYKSNPDIFQWPASLEKVFPGIYVEQNFGNGCIANFSALNFWIYWHRLAPEYVKDEETGEYHTKYYNKRDSICLFTSAPEVTSANLIRYDVSQKIRDMIAAGESVITTPGGYLTDITFPADKIIEQYRQNVTPLTVVSKLSLRIPAENIKNDYGIGVAPYLLMVKKSEREDFFRNNRIPDDITSFYAPYNTADKSYSFEKLRQYILNLINSGKEVTAEDMEFSLVPVNIVTEIQEGYYGAPSTMYVTRCGYYTARPTMTRLHTERAVICFTYSKQMLE